jgi:anti-sigma factor ChrR (cupin superfamily)
MNCPDSAETWIDYLDGELAPKEAASLRRHLADCPACGSVLAGLQQADSALGTLANDDAPTSSLLAIQQRIQQELGMAKQREILTLEEAADFLRIEPEELAECLNDLPWFELAGRIRFRRQALLDWVRQRERECTRERLSRSLQRELRTSA